MFTGGGRRVGCLGTEGVAGLVDDRTHAPCYFPSPAGTRLDQCYCFLRLCILWRHLVPFSAGGLLLTLSRNDYGQVACLTSRPCGVPRTFISVCRLFERPSTAATLQTSVFTPLPPFWSSPYQNPLLTAATPLAIPDLPRVEIRRVPRF